MIKQYYVVRAESYKEVEVTDRLRTAREKAIEINGLYERVSKQQAKRIAERTQWGLLPEDITALLN